MKAKKMTQKLTLLTFTALFIAFMFNACSDVAGPNENLNNEYSQLSSSETEMQDFRRFTSTRTGGGEGDETAPSCTLTDQVITYGGANESFEQRISNDKNVGTISVTFDNGKITLTAKVDDPELWAIDKTDLLITKDYNNASDFPPNPGRFPYNDEWDNVEEVSYTKTLSDYGIQPGDEFAVAMHVNVVDLTGITDDDSQSAWGGEEEGTSNRMYFIINYGCPSSPVVGYVN